MSSINLNWDTKELEQYLDSLKKLAEEDLEELIVQTIKEVAARTLAKIVERTPIGEYKDQWVNFIAYKGTDKEKEVKFFARNAKVGGTLRRGWTGGKEIDPHEYIYNHTNVMKKSTEYIIILSNNVNYASWVENGHETINGGWVEGQFFMKISIDEINGELESMVANKIEKFLGDRL